MTLGLFTDDFYPHIGGMGRYVCEMTSRLPTEDLLIFSPCENDIPNHIQIKPKLHEKFKNLSMSYWLHNNINDLIDNFNLSRINIQCGPGGIFLLKKPGRPVIATCHHTWWQQSRYIKSQFWKAAFIPFEKRTYQQADRIICDAEDSQNILHARYGISLDKMAVIPIGVDAEKFYPIRNIEKIPYSLFYIGRIDKRKGVDFLIKAMPRVAKEIPEARLFVGGTGKDLVKLKKYVTQFNLNQNVKFLGFVSEDKLNEWYNKVNCVVVPSVFEGFGLTAVEAMAAGTSVIATNVDSLRIIVEDNINGLLVEYNDTVSLSEKIIFLLRHQAKQKEFIAKGLQKVATVFNWDYIMKRNLQELFDLSE
jgi:glycosyltransferase involved in cell wall biosynthesis